MVSCVVKYVAHPNPFLITSVCIFFIHCTHVKDAIANLWRLSMIPQHGGGGRGERDRKGTEYDQVLDSLPHAPISGPVHPPQKPSEQCPYFIHTLLLLLFPFNLGSAPPLFPVHQLLILYASPFSKSLLSITPQVWDPIVNTEICCVQCGSYLLISINLLLIVIRGSKPSLPHTSIGCVNK